MELNEIAEKHGLKHLADGDAWMLAEDIPNVDFFFCQIWLRAFVNNMDASCGQNYSKILGIFTGTDMAFYYGRKSCLDFTLNLVKKIEADPAYGEQINRNITKFSDALEASAVKIPQDCKQLSNEELWNILDEHVRVHTELYEWGWLPNATDMFYSEFTELLKKYLRSKVNSEEQVNALFVALTSPSQKSEEARQHEEFLKLAIEIENSEFHKKLFLHKSAGEIEQEMRGAVRERLLGYYEKYSPISALWIGEKQPLSHYISELSNYLKQGKSPAADLEEIGAKLKMVEKEKERLDAELGIDQKHKRLFGVFGEFMLTKLYRRYRQLRALYRLRPVFKEIARRFGITLDQARFMRTPEYRQLLVDGTFDTSVLAERMKFTAFYAEQGRDLVLEGGIARELAETAVEKFDKDISEIRGQCACLGKATGRVKIVLSPADLPKMQQGDILVAIATNPDVVPAMKKAAAIVTEQGGVTSHAAIVSREMNIPCVIGTKIATKVLKDGDLVEVDATKGIVKRL